MEIKRLLGVFNCIMIYEVLRTVKNKGNIFFKLKTKTFESLKKNTINRRVGILEFEMRI